MMQEWYGWDDPDGEVPAGETVSLLCSNRI
jgi:hypothetical protein